MKTSRSRNLIRITVAILIGIVLFTSASCGLPKDPGKNLAEKEEKNLRIVNLFSPMEKTDPDAENVTRSALDQTVIFAEETLGIKVEYITYTAENHQDKTYDDVALDRAHNNMDDIYLLNPDVIHVLGREDRLMDLSNLDSAKNLRDVVKTANVVNGKLVAIPQEVVAYGLFVNVDMFDRYNLELPETPEEFLECCRVFQENGIETPVGANRWWLETFVLAMAYADLYNGGNTAAEIEALNNATAKYSDYMRPGFEFLQELIDKGYIDAEKAYVSEAIEGEGPDFLAQKTPIVIAYWGAANAETAYGSPDFHMQVIGFPSSRGQMPVIPMTGLAVGVGAEHVQDAMLTLNAMVSDQALQIYAETNKVISPSKNVEVDCIPALRPLNDRIQENVYVLGSNANMRLEQWGNVCLVVRQLLSGATVDECMEEFDRLQEESLQDSSPFFP